jgi:hypothetical protein
VRWIKISIFNFTLLALLGSILRYKIAFSLPFIDQKNLLHAHSHFAFAGWVSQILMCLLLYALSKDTIEWENKIKKFGKIFLLNLITAYGMLITFAYQGYAMYSIIFSTASILVSYWFAFSVNPIIKESNIHVITKKYFYAALLFNVISSLGPFSLAFMMVSHSVNQDYLLGAVFYYLHFQYNGWFLFMIFGTLNEQVAKQTENFEFKRNFNVLIVAAIMTLFLSLPWIDKQNMLGIVLFAIVIMQLMVFISFLRSTEEGSGPPLILNSKIKIPLKRIFTFAILIKGVLQILILVPSLDQYAFGLRPVIIAYLHLVLIGVVSFYIFHYLIREKILMMNKNLNKGLLIFLGGFILNEIVLVLQGLSWLNIVGLPLTNESLFLAALLMLSGLIVVTRSVLKNAAIESEKFREMPFIE